MTEKKTITFMSPHAGIWVHALPESHLARFLQSEEFEVRRISCDGTFAVHCTVMSANALAIDADSAKKQKICRQCVNNAQALRPSYDGVDYVLSKFLTQSDEEEIRRLVDSLNIASAHDFLFDGIEVGRIASYEVLLQFKKASLSFHGIEIEYLLTYIRNALRALFAFKRIFAIDRPDVLITYSPQYGVNGVCARFCEMQGVPVYFIEGSSNIHERYGALRVWDWSAFGLTNPALQYWDRGDRIQISDDHRRRARKHVECLLNATSFSVYSTPAMGHSGLRERFGVPKDARLILAAMSSYDEAFSAYVIRRFPPQKYLSDVFADQLEWIAHTVEFLRSRPDLFLIIRIHPRTFPSKRENVMAAEQQQLEKLFEKLPANVRVNYPADNISIYDLYKEIDVLVTGWSATGVEAMSFGVPVVTFDSNVPSYPATIHYTGRSREEYESNLVAAAAAGRHEEISFNAHEWMAFSMCVGVVRHPRPFRAEPIVSDSAVLRLALRVMETLVPVLIKRLEMRRPSRHLEDTRRVRELIARRLRSLYDVSS